MAKLLLKDALQALDASIQLNGIACLIEELNKLRSYICMTCAELHDCMMCECCYQYSCANHCQTNFYTICNACCNDAKNESNARSIQNNEICWACADSCINERSIARLVDNNEISHQEADFFSDTKYCAECSRVMCVLHARLNLNCATCSQRSTNKKRIAMCDVVFSKSACVAKIPPRSLFWDTHSYEDSRFNLHGYQYTDTCVLGYLEYYFAQPVKQIIHEYIGDTKQMWRSNIVNIPASFVAYSVFGENAIQILSSSSFTDADRYAFYWMATNKRQGYCTPEIPAEILSMLVPRMFNLTPTLLPAEPAEKKSI
jgi:hypothetical protein